MSITLKIKTIMQLEGAYLIRSKNISYIISTIRNNKGKIKNNDNLVT